LCQASHKLSYLHQNGHTSRTLCVRPHTNL